MKKRQIEKHGNKHERSGQVCARARAWGASANHSPAAAMGPGHGRGGGVGRGIPSLPPATTPQHPSRSIPDSVKKPKANRTFACCRKQPARSCLKWSRARKLVLPARAQPTANIPRWPWPRGARARLSLLWSQTLPAGRPFSGYQVISAWKGRLSEAFSLFFLLSFFFFRHGWSFLCSAVWSFCCFCAWECLWDCPCELTSLLFFAKVPITQK